MRQQTNTNRPPRVSHRAKARTDHAPIRAEKALSSLEISDLDFALDFLGIGAGAPAPIRSYLDVRAVVGLSAPARIAAYPDDHDAGR